MSIREGYETLPAHEWNADEARHHLAVTFDRCVKTWPDILDPYVVLLIEANPDEEIEIMRRALRETVLLRYASPWEEGDRANG
jgi:hypothetical protein